MKCKECQEALVLFKFCQGIQMRCTGCGRRFSIHEVIDQLDAETEKMLERYNAIIYD